ncbi:MAG: hypothetical protein KKA73_28795 [Chloroflexi bacterium]|nr:hypothetical protein [Chloroflexota bacterium]
MPLVLHPAAYLVRELGGPTLASGVLEQIDLLSTSLHDPAVHPVLRAWTAAQAQALGLAEQPRLWCVSDSGLLSVHVWPAAAERAWPALAAHYTDSVFHYEVWT